MNVHYFDKPLTILGDHVLKRNVRKVLRKGDRLVQDWLGPYQTVDVTPKGLCTLQDSLSKTMKAKVNIGHLKPYLTIKLPIKEEITSVTLTNNSNNSNNNGLPDSPGEVIVKAALPGSPPVKKKCLVNCDTEQGSMVISPPEINSSPSDCTVISSLHAQPRKFGELLKCKPPPLYRERP